METDSEILRQDLENRDKPWDVEHKEGKGKSSGEPSFKWAQSDKPWAASFFLSFIPQLFVYLLCQALLETMSKQTKIPPSRSFPSRGKTQAINKEVSETYAISEGDKKI